MRLMLLVLPLLLLLGAVSWAQTSSPMEASPAAMASPGPSGGMMGSPRWVGRSLIRRGSDLPAASTRRANCGLVLRALLALSAIFALTALGIFLIRRSRPRP